MTTDDWLDLLQHITEPTGGSQYERWGEDPRIGTPIYAIIPDFIDPRSDELDRYPLAEGEPQCLYGSHASGEFTPYRGWPVDHDYAREDGQDRKLTQRLIGEVRSHGMTGGGGVPCPYCQQPLLERGPHGPPLREPVPIWAGGLLGWVHRSCHGR